jgi:hypothetical protein
MPSLALASSSSCVFAIEYPKSTAIADSSTAMHQHTLSPSSKRSPLQFPPGPHRVHRWAHTRTPHRLHLTHLRPQSPQLRASHKLRPPRLQKPFLPRFSPNHAPFPLLLPSHHPNSCPSPPRNPRPPHPRPLFLSISTKQHENLHRS